MHTALDEFFSSRFAKSIRIAFIMGAKKKKEKKKGGGESETKR